MGKGDISTGSLIAIFLAVIVLSIFAYLIFFYGKNPGLDCALCRSKFTHWCQMCAIQKENWNQQTWTEDVAKDQYLEDCMQDCLDISPDYCNKNTCDPYLINTTFLTTSTS